MAITDLTEIKQVSHKDAINQLVIAYTKLYNRIAALKSKVAAL